MPAKKLAKKAATIAPSKPKAKTEALIKKAKVRVKPPTKAETASQLKQNKLVQKWTSLYNKSKNVKAEPYNMKKVYEPNTPINHKLLGWGYILDNKNDRLEILFKDGVKYLISNYK